MEIASWFIHKYIMHGPLWNIHKTHHEHNHSRPELNDVFSLFFGGTAVVLLVYGLEHQYDWITGAGIGISLYGFTYFLLHDLLIHRRIKLINKINNPVLKALAEAHHDHHKTQEKDNGVSFGLLLVHKKYFKKHFYRKNQKS